MTDMSNAAAPQPYRINVEQFHKMGAAGVFEPDARIELLEGELLTMAPIGARHGSAVSALMRLLLRSALDDRAFVWSQGPLVLLPMSQLQPDAMLLRPRPDEYRNAEPTPADVLLLVEVSDSTINFDRRRKLPVYARHGIPEVWIVNIQERRLEVFRDPNDVGYGATFVQRAGETITAAAFPDVPLDWGVILGPEN